MRTVPVATLPLANDPTPVLNKLDSLLAERDDVGVKTLFSAVIDSYNRHLKAALLQKYHTLKAEGVTTAELVDLFKSLDFVLTQEANSADQKLKAMTEPKEKEAKKPKQAPPRKRAVPEHLPVVANEIKVPGTERPCPLCGQERICIGHDITRVIDLEPARIIVRCPLESPTTFPDSLRSALNSNGRAAMSFRLSSTNPLTKPASTAIGRGKSTTMCLK